MPPQVDKEIKQRKDLKILNPNKLFTKISVLLAQIKAGNDSNKLNMIVIRDPVDVYFCFDWPKDVDKNLKHEIQLIIKSNESSAEKKNDIHKHGKQQNE